MKIRLRSAIESEEGVGRDPMLMGMQRHQVLSCISDTVTFRKNACRSTPFAPSEEITILRRLTFTPRKDKFYHKLTKAKYNAIK